MLYRVRQPNEGISKRCGMQTEALFVTAWPATILPWQTLTEVCLCFLCHNCTLLPNSWRTLFDPAAAQQVRQSGGNSRRDGNGRGGGGGGRGGGGRIVGLDTLNKADHSKC